MSGEDFDQHDFDVADELTPVAEPLGSTDVWLQDPVPAGLAPTAFEPASWSSDGPLEEAVVIWPDFAPAAGELPPTPVAWTSPAGEVALLGGVDLNGDGVVDLVALDANGDGVVDTWLMDTTGVPSATTGAFFADAMFVDTSGDGLANCVCRDVDGTGAFEAPLELAPEPVAPAPAPAPAAPVAQAPAAPAVSTGDPLIDALEKTDDPATIDGITRIMEIRTRAASVWL